MSRKRSAVRRTAEMAYQAAASFELAIACFAVLMALVVACTLAQVELGTWGAVDVYMRSWFVWWRMPGTDVSVPAFPGGVLVGVTLAANLLAAQWKRLELSWRKSGIWVAHAGVVLLVVGEFVTGALQDDSRMAFQEGETASFVESPREVELALIDTTDSSFDDVFAIPESLLAQGGSIAVPGTPLSIDVKRYFRNAAFSLRGPDDPPLVTAGAGTDVATRELPPVSSDDQVNRSAALVEPIAGGRNHGTWLVSNALATPQSFVHEGRTYSLEMRARRQYLPYTLTLKDFRREVHAGTTTPRHFSSLVHLSNRSTGEERDVLISMNQPLRYGGRTFYQASFGDDDRLSILQVVENPGWALPYVSGALVVLGLLAHFGLRLSRSTRRTETAAASAVHAPKPTAVPALRYAAWAAGVVAVSGLLVGALPQRQVRGFDLETFSAVPVLDAGRLKPIDSVARNALLTISGRQSFQHDGRRVEAREWLLDLMFRPQVADQYAVFLVDDPDVLGLVGVRQSSERRVPVNVLAPRLAAIQQQSARARDVAVRDRTRFQTAVVRLEDRLRLYTRLRNTIQVWSGPALEAEIAGASSPASAARRARLSELAAFRTIPPVAPGDEAWRSTGEALDGAAAGTAHPALVQWARISRAWTAQDPSAFNRATADLRREMTRAAPEPAATARLELTLNRAQPFYAGIVIYVVAMLVLFASWLGKPALLRAIAFGFLTAGLLVHTTGIAARIYLQGRPPVTNLYSSAVFVGWAAVILGVLLERRYRRGFGTATAAASGFASLLVAHHLTGDGDTMEMMRAVLDSNFWLATHVVAITIGYSGAFLAGAFGIAYAVRRHLARSPDPSSTKALVSATHGVVCFALFFSFLGTLLGGIWADQSWGRFWGWDPKENGALLIVLWNAAILHARWAGFVRERGIMAMAIFGNVITSISWFGVNMLGVGLHSYGFMDEAVWALTAFGASQVTLMLAAVAPPRLRFGRLASLQAELSTSPITARPAPRVRSKRPLK